jgi:hypothetical protein
MLSCSISSLNFSFLFHSLARTAPAQGSLLQKCAEAAVPSVVRRMLPKFDLDKFALFAAMSNLTPSRA